MIAGRDCDCAVNKHIYYSFTFSKLLLTFTTCSVCKRQQECHSECVVLPVNVT